MAETGTPRLKTGLAEMLKGGVIMDVVNADQARIAEAAGAVAVMALERVPADIRAQGGVARMAAVSKVREIQDAVTVPVMAKVRIGHFVEAQILQSLAVDFIDESEVLTPADESFHIDKHSFKVPFVCGARDLGEALRRIGEGAALIRTKGEAGSGNIVEAVRHMRAVNSAIRRLTTMGPDELMTAAKDLGAPYELVRIVAQSGKLPVPNFAAGGIATPADAALMMQLGAESVFVGSGIFKSEDPAARAKAIVMATTHYKDPEILARVSDGLGEAMPGLESRGLSRRKCSRRADGSATMKIGVLALQGDFAAHLAAIPGAVEVRTATAIAALDVLVIPGGESTTMLKLLEGSGIEAATRRLVARGGAVFGTCAGAILLARNVSGPTQPSWGMIDIDIERNAFGRQIDSFEATLDPPLKGVFIRAPRIRRVGPGVEVIARFEGEPVLVRQGRIFAATFHPELTDDRRVYQMILGSGRAGADWLPLELG